MKPINHSWNKVGLKKGRQREPLPDVKSAQTPEEWLRLNSNEMIHCEIRKATIHRRHCASLRDAVPTANKNYRGELDLTLQNVNICNTCPETKKKLRIRKEDLIK
jgi:hypothetical protein